jgi:hypothetical protein
VLPEGARRFLGLSRDCASCHDDAHEGAMQLACASCHGQATWDGLASLGHERWLPLLGGHGALACTECHAEAGPHDLDVLGRLSERPAPRECSACHRSPHSEGFTTNSAAFASLPAGQACVTCHAPEHESFREPQLAEMSAEQHAASGFPLAAPHDALECAQCHDPERKRFERRHPGRAPGQCSACHADPHRGEFVQGPFAGEECTACHAPLAFEPHAFDAEEHARAALPLDGKHAELACEACHALPDSPEEADAGPRTFRSTPDDCDACHADAHAGFFAPFVAGRAAPEHGECARCHDTTRFDHAGADFDHRTFTGFAVLGAHAESACTACHETRDEADEAGRTFGRVEDRFGSSAVFEDCAACHADPHGGLFDARGKPATVEGEPGCARCHDVASFRALRRAFEHGSWTGFALAGAHAQASCSACHAPIPGASRQGRTSAEAAGASCADCHEDPHARQFADDLGFTRCERCHDAARPDFLSFDHEEDSRFQLGEAHRGLECAKCHVTEEREGLAVVHYQPLAILCVDCHGKNAEVLLRRLPRGK